jgi:hypothetical protein
VLQRLTVPGHVLGAKVALSRVTRAGAGGTDVVDLFRSSRSALTLKPAATPPRLWHPFNPTE